MNTKKLLQFLKAFILPVAFYVLFIVLSKGRMANSKTLLNVLRQAVYPAVITFAIYSVNMLGLWDLCPGVIMITSTVISGNLAVSNSWGLPGFIIGVFIICFIMCMLNCTVQVVTKIPSMIVSFGMAMFYESISAISFSGKFTAPRAWTFFSKSPWCYIILIMCFMLLYIVTYKMKFGFNVRALGSNSAIATNIGVNVKKTIYRAYALESVFLTCAALIYVSMNGSSSAAMNLATTSIGFNAIVSYLVGQFLAVYCGPIFGVLIGAVTLKILGSGLLALGLAATWQNVANGLFLILFLGFSQNQKVVAEARERKNHIKEIMERIKAKETI